MIPSSVILRNFRCFARRAEIQLRPITLLYGINNAGKSALLRALPLLGDSVSAEAKGPLDLESPAARGSTFRDIRWKGIQPEDDPEIEIEIEWMPDPRLPHRVTYWLHWADMDEWRGIVVRRLEIADDIDTLSATWDPTSGASSYTFSQPSQGPSQGQSQGQSGELVFDGLLPSSVIAEPEAIAERVRGARIRLERLRNQVQWLQAVRRLPTQRIIPTPAAPRTRMRPDGSDAAAVLATSDAVRDEVSQWYERLVGRKLVLQEVPPHGFKLMLQPLQRAELDVELANTGEGMIQVLPILTGLAVAGGFAKGGPRLLAIEEPESHLHPRLQRELAQHLCSLAARDPGSRIVLETHSHHVLLGVQLAMASGELQPADVSLHWVRQLEDGQGIVELVEIDELGQLVGNWPPGVFDDDTDVARQIIKKRRERRGQGS